MTGLKKTILVGIITLVLGLAGNFVKNKFSVFADDLGATKAQVEEQIRLTTELKTSQEEMKKYIDLNLKLTNDKIKLQKQYADEIARINNERFDKITLFSKPGTSNIIIAPGMHDIFGNFSSQVNPVH